MKNFKKNIALLAALACAGTMLAGCSSDNAATDDAATNDNAAADNAADAGSADAAEEGKLLKICGWNTEFQGLFETYYAGTSETPYEKAPGLPEGVNVEFVITANEGNAYQNTLDSDLEAQAGASGDDLIDMFLFEADYALKYVNSDYTMNIKDLGLTDADLAEMYQYTKDICTDSNGALKGVSWQATPGLFAYRRSIAKDVLGSDDPATVQEALKDWDAFNATAASAKEKGYYMLSGYDDAYRTFSNNVAAPWVNDQNQIVIDDNIWKWVDQTAEFTEKGYNNKTSLWSDGWSADQGADGKVFGFFYSTWGINFTLLGNAGDAGFGDWAVCEGPQNYYWGGSWLAAATGTDNKTLVADVMKWMTCNGETMTAITNDTQDYTNNAAAMNALASSDFKSDFLGGQNHIALFAESAPKIDMSNISGYDQGLNEAFQGAFKDYFDSIANPDREGGQVDKDTALKNFYTAAIEKYPELTAAE